jgi:hypothetical protein
MVSETQPSCPHFRHVPIVGAWCLCCQSALQIVSCAEKYTLAGYQQCQLSWWCHRPSGLLGGAG